jgi:hypothetical protein
MEGLGEVGGTDGGCWCVGAGEVVSVLERFHLNDNVLKICDWDVGGMLTYQSSA